MDLIPPQLKALIPKSTLHRFKNTDYSSVFGSDLYSSLFQHIDILKQLLGSRHLLTLLKACLFVKNKLLSLSHSLKEHTLSFKHKVVTAILRARDTLGFARSLRYFGLTKTKFYSWFYQIKNICAASLFSKCLRIWPNQLTTPELNKMKNLIRNPRFSSRPIASLAYDAFRNRIVTAALSTWYKYAPHLGYSRK